MYDQAVKQLVVTTTPKADLTRVSERVALFDDAGNSLDLLSEAEAVKRFRKVFNVLDYGAVGDGVTSCVSAFNNAISAASVVGGIVYIPAGTYVVTEGFSNVAVLSNVTICGDGSASILKDATGNVSQLVVANKSNVLIENLSFIGTGVLGTAGRGAIWLYQSSYVTIRNVSINGVGTCGVALGDSNFITVDNVTVGNIAEHGVYVSNSTDCRVLNCRVTGAGQAGGVSTVVGIKVSTSTRTKVDNCLVTNSLTEGITCDSTDTKISNCYIHSNAQRGIRLLAGSARAVIFGNTIANNTTGDIRDFGSVGSLILDNSFPATTSPGTNIKLDSGTVGVEVRDNDIKQGPSGGWSIDITGSTHRILRNRIRGCDYGIVIRATTTGCVVSNNDVTATSTGYSDSSGTNPLKVVSGSRGSNAALASLITQLAALGLISDTTTA